MLFTLCYAFWFSYARIGSDSFSPTLWPLLWLILVAAYLLNPLPIAHKPARWWLLKNVSRLLTSGTHRVEFTDFWMGDQFCSLVFTLSNLYFVACAYSHGLEENWQRCTSRNRLWGVPFVLASLPLLVRAVQSVKRWFDSRLVTHLINGGKYATGIIYYLCYFIWRNQGAGRGGSFAAWCLFGTIYSSYAAAWDLLMDWSFLRPHVYPPFLRSELLYRNAVPMYYFAIITNIFIRFIWVFYIPERGPDFLIRTFIAGMLEALRRWQWNFFRLENEHLGNMDQYRVTREVPLPYSLDDAAQDDSDDEEERKSHSSKRWRRRSQEEEGSDPTQQ
ncbi:EXS-domain-containing protein [Panus rudis PR-1116 ss-1]|nr:EXS-domain-containing protein [Panus rudis PR-1116 ss-1]